MQPVVTVPCCLQPKLDSSWKLRDDCALLLENITCGNCGAQWLADDRDGTACPLISYSADRKQLLIRLRPVPVVPS